MGHTKKIQLQTRMFAPSVEVMLGKEKLKDLAGRAKKEKGSVCVSVKEVKEFLELSAESHRSFFKYTRLQRLKNILEDKTFVLSRLSEMNDINECDKTEDANRIYVGCLAFGIEENMSMWRMYGGEPDDIAVRLEFKGTDIRKLFGSSGKCRIYKGEMKGGTLVKGEEVKDCEYEKSFHDVAYLYGDALLWRRKVMGISRCPDIRHSVRFATYVKSYGWANEDEVRFAVTLKKTIPGLKHLVVDFESAIKNMKVLIGPAISRKRKVERVMAEYGFGIENGQVSESRYEADFQR